MEDWAWQKQLRFYLKGGKAAVIKMSSARFAYSYEYQGNASKLVHTPLTDKCYLTLTQVRAWVGRWASRTALSAGCPNLLKARISMTKKDCRMRLHFFPDDITSLWLRGKRSMFAAEDAHGMGCSLYAWVWVVPA